MGTNTKGLLRPAHLPFPGAEGRDHSPTLSPDSPHPLPQHTHAQRDSEQPPQRSALCDPRGAHFPSGPPSARPSRGRNRAPGQKWTVPSRGIAETGRSSAPRSYPEATVLERRLQLTPASLSACAEYIYRQHYSSPWGSRRPGRQPLSGNLPLFQQLHLFNQPAPH